MNPGKLNRRITLQKPDIVRDETGQAKTNWIDVATVWAAILPLKGKEFFDSARVTSEITVRVIIRYRKDVAPSWRVAAENKTYEVIEIINPSDGREQLQLMCKRVE